MIYIVSFLLTLIADRIRKQRPRMFYVILIWLFVFLCFGYMTGSDWREYELLYDGTNNADRFSERETGFVILMNIFRTITKDFWIFTACAKMFFLYSLIDFFSNFTQKKILALGLSFSCGTLFLLIDCPMRFMIALAIIFIALRHLMNGNKIMFIILSFIAVCFHFTSIIVILILLGGYLARNKIASMNLYVLYFIFIGCITVLNQGYIKELIYALGTKITLFASYLDWYTEDKGSQFSLMALIKTFFLGSVIIVNKDKLLLEPNGKLIFSLSYISLTVGLLFSLIPTGFRMNILPSYFQIISLVLLFFGKCNSNKLTVNKLIKYAICLVTVMLIGKEITSYKYTPYTNSIKYIMMGHLPYSYRDNYNKSMNNN